MYQHRASVTDFLLLSFAIVGAGHPQSSTSDQHFALAHDSGAGGAGLTLTIHGTGFVSTSTANWNGSPRATTFVSDSELTVAIPSSDIANPGTAAITVTNPTPGGGTSNVATFDVTSPVSTLQFATENFSAVQNLAFFAADLNGDGKIDLVGGLSLMALCVSLGVGDGSFQSPVCIPDAPPMTALIAGDFNGDGKLDLAGVNDDGLYIFLGNGDGTFQAPQNFQLAAVDPPQAVTLTSGDFNGDGKLDLVLAGPDAGLTTFWAMVTGHSSRRFITPSQGVIISPSRWGISTGTVSWT
jgi:FG-GAP-like repeat/IPT/TIG domain